MYVAMLHVDFVLVFSGYAKGEKVIDPNGDFPLDWPEKFWG